MHSANGIDLQGSEYRELVALAKAERSGKGAKALADASLRPDGETIDRRAMEVYRGLLDVGLIDATPVWGGLLFHGINQRGLDFVDDYAASQKAEEDAKKAQWAHDWKVAAFGAVSGGVLGLVSGAFSSQFVNALAEVFL